MRLTLLQAATTSMVGKAINLIGGLLLLLAGYFALVARRSEEADQQQKYRRNIIQAATVFLMFTYAAAVLVPNVKVWPVEFGWQLLEYFQQLDTVPETVDSELTAFYTALMEKVGVVAGPETTTAEDPLAYILKPIRTLGLVVYTLFFSAASLGLQVPRRIGAGLGSSTGDDE